MRKAVRNRIWIYGTIVTVVVGGYFYQPVRIDFFPKALPSPNPPVDPDSAELFKKGARVMVVTAHPDDTEYYLSGFLLKLAKAGVKIDLVVCTDGDKGFYLWENAARNRAERRSEQLAVAKRWNADAVEFLGFPDGRLHPNPDVIAAIHERILKYKPAWLVAFDGDYPPHVSHGDHRSSGQAALPAAAGTSVRWAMLFATRAGNYVTDVSDTEESARELLAIHASQFAGQKLDAVAATVMDQSSQDGDKAGFTYGIAFRCVRLEPPYKNWAATVRLPPIWLSPLLVDRFGCLEWSGCFRKAIIQLIDGKGQTIRGNGLFVANIGSAACRLQPRKAAS